MEFFLSPEQVEPLIRILLKEVKKLRPEVLDSKVFKYKNKPWIVLVATLLSLRTKDEVTEKVADRLFSVAPDLDSILKMTHKEIEKLIYPVGFYRQKAKRLKLIAKIIKEKYNGKVPETEEELLSLPGVGRKTANLVLSKGYNIPTIAVDTHVHRISNRLGWVNTRTPLNTEKELKKVLPKKYWTIINRLLVVWGQHICRPISPFCSKCAISDFCQKIGVKKHR